MYLYYFNEDCTCRQRKIIDVIPNPMPLYGYVSENFYLIGNVTATDIILGVVQGISIAPAPEEKFIHVSIEAPETGNDGVPSVAYGEIATITFTIRNSADPASPIWQVSPTIRLPYRHNGSIGYFRIPFVNGQFVFSFSPGIHDRGKRWIDSADIGLISGYVVKIVGNTILLIDEKSG